ncbi:MAG: multifunctional oxoglutarate decarboxylase/oxoglutarate dehydrogenase thiamine pyrophosphate-binding subunit/dihydrolipoyllysine-residue succinyltransferase subunit [Terriglobales bacterium]
MATSEAQSAIDSYLETLGANEGYGRELWRLYQANSQAVPEAWQAIFSRFGGNGHQPGRPAAPAASAGAATVATAPAVALLEGDEAQPLRGAAARLAANMEASLSVPTATSQRTLAVGLLEANRKKLNQALAERKQKLSLTPLLGWAIVRAIADFPALNSAYTVNNGQPSRVARAHVNLGLAVDVERAGGRSLLVPAVKRAEAMTFAEFFAECDRLIQAARSGKISPDDLQGSTVSLTNPGTLGTRASVPRLMAGQGAIIAAGAVAYPQGFENVPEATLQVLGVGKSFTLACTYDHRIVQGAESGAFLARVDALLGGADGFYERIYKELGIAGAPILKLAAAPLAAAQAAPAGGMDLETVRKQVAVNQLVHAYRVRGHLLAEVDPLRMKAAAGHPELDPAHYGLTEADMQERFLCPLAGRGAEADPTCALGDILEVLRAAYCGHLALEFMHLQSTEERQWLQDHMEPAAARRGMAAEEQRVLLRRLTHAEEFEHLLHARFVGHKRFSLEGAEAMIAVLDDFLERAAADGAQEAVLGMAHRGRLNVLVNVLGLSMSEMFSKFEDADPESVEGSGDVKYHIGAVGAYQTRSGAALPVEMINNPSHLEAVDPVVEGSTRARQDLRGRSGEDRGRQVIPILIHGDAAFAGQGVVAETLNLSQLGGYRTGGTLHLVVNNQIGFTTSPAGARSSLYCTDVARTVQAPIFHVNGDDPEAVVRATALAFAFRRQFHKDVVVDMVCYRRHGHNEADDPSLTSPVMYRNIDEHPSVRVLYAAELVRRGLLSEAEAEAERQAVKEELAAQAAQPVPAAAAASEPAAQEPATGVAEATLARVGERLGALPEGFQLHPKLKGFMSKRQQAIAGRGAIDWSLAEALALGSLGVEGTPVRLSGQDTGRGTFSQRHAVLYDFQTGAPYIPLAHIDPQQQAVEIYDSLLSEEAALGFEFGYALTHPTALVLWEAQFGDFANGAQVVIDQFLAASETKWARTCGLTLLLPHGFEGQGPEHSSARLERFLQLSADDNWRVANCTTAAQYFHLLRSQGLRRPHRPLVVLTPKSLLRHPEVASPLAALTTGAFQTVLGDSEADAGQVRRVLLCSGKIYYDLAKARKAQKKAGVAIVRVEQLYPFPAEAIAAELRRYSALSELCWAQEEPENMGAWTFVAPRLQALLPTGASLAHVSRKPSASPATGSLRRHTQEQAALVGEALG